MALHGEDVASVGVLEALDDPVGRPRGDAQGRRDVAHGLAVRAVDGQGLGTEHAGYSDVLDVAAAHAGEIVKSFDGGVTSEQAMAATFDANPDLYALYLAEKGGN